MGCAGRQSMNGADEEGERTIRTVASKFLTWVSIIPWAGNTVGVWDILSLRCQGEIRKGDIYPRGRLEGSLVPLIGPICRFRFRGGQPKDSS